MFVALDNALNLVSVAFPDLRVGDSSKIVGVDVHPDGSFTVVSKGRERTLFAEIALAVAGGVRQNNQILLVVGVRAFDEPDGGRCYSSHRVRPGYRKRWR